MVKIGIWRNYNGNLFTGINVGAVTHADNVQSSSQNTQPKNESKQSTQSSQRVVLKSSQSLQSQTSSVAAKTPVQGQPQGMNFAAVSFT